MRWKLYDKLSGWPDSALISLRREEEKSDGRRTSRWDFYGKDNGKSKQ